MIWWIIVIGLVAMAFKANLGGIATTASSGITSLGRIIGFDPSRLSSPGANEEQDILQTAASYGIDARLLSAIRMQENGGPGRQYGILGIGADTLQAQLSAAANTIKRTIGRYYADTGLSVTDDAGRYTPDFISYLANGGPSYGGWAPIGASNDPTNLNQYWLTNVLNNYYSTEVVA